jgi:prephenate dehydratase
MNADRSPLRVAIQGELGSNSHMAALALFEGTRTDIQIVPCAISADAFASLLDPTIADAAVLPIENSLHGSVAEHYDLLLQRPVQIVAESLLRIRFNLIAMPGVAFADLRRVLSHPVALAQCRRFLAAHREIEALPFYDTAGSVKHLMERELQDTAGIAPELAAIQYGATILQSGLEDHTSNFTRFHLVCRRDQEETQWAALLRPHLPPNKMTVAFSVEHRPGTLVQALQRLAAAKVDLTRIESRPVPGRPWEYIFYVEVRFDDPVQAENALADLTAHCYMVKELGRYRAA